MSAELAPETSRVRVEHGADASRQPAAPIARARPAGESRGLASEAPLRHFWSLAIEEQFYLFWPLAVWLLPERRLRAACVGALAVSFALRFALASRGEPGFALYVLTPTHWDPLALGAGLAVLLRDPQARPRVARWAKNGFVAAGALFGIVWALAGPDPIESVLMQSIGYPLLAFTCTAAVACAQLGLGARPILGAAWLRYLGWRSYALYVLHPLLLAVVLQLGFDVPTLSQQWRSVFLAQTAFALATLAPTLALGELSWRILEGPILRLKHHFPRPAPVLRAPVLGGPEAVGSGGQVV